MQHLAEFDHDPTVAANDLTAPPLTLVPDVDPAGFTIDVACAPIEGGTDPTYGEVTWQTLICADQTPSKEFVLGKATFGPGERLHPHRHEPAEFYYCIAGSGDIVIEGKLHSVHVGVAVYLPSNAEHSVTAGADGLSILYGFAQARFADVEYQFSAK